MASWFSRNITTITRAFGLAVLMAACAGLTVVPARAASGAADTEISAAAVDKPQRLPAVDASQKAIATTAILEIEKRCDPAVVGGRVGCTISVTNISKTAVRDDVAISDLTRILAGPDAGQVVPVSAVSAAADRVRCGPVPARQLTCTVKAAALLPGQRVSFRVVVDTASLAKSGNAGVRNCALLNHASGKAEVCAEGGTELVVEKIGPGRCAPGAACRFGLKIMNVGDRAFSGPVMLADVLTIGGAVKTLDVTAFVPPLRCDQGNASQLPFACQTTLSLAPGEQRLHWIDVVMPSPGGYEAENCFGALDPALLTSDTLSSSATAGTDNKGNPSCVTVSVPKPRANLRLRKTVSARSPCVASRDDIVCGYEIAITNDSDAAYNGPISFHEITPTGATLQPVDAGFTCSSAANGYTCDSGHPVVIAGADTRVVPVRLTLSRDQARAANCRISNTAELVTPKPGSPGNTSADDDRDTATATPSGRLCREPDRIVIPPPIRCPDRSRRKHDGSCCPPGTTVSARGTTCEEPEPECPAGYDWDARQETCSPRTSCPPRHRFNVRIKRCEPIVVECPPGQTRDLKTGVCIPVVTPCTEGQHYSRRQKSCVPDTGVKPCPRGMYRFHGRCRPKIVPCRKGQIRIRGTCRNPASEIVPIDPPGLQPCRKGQVRVNGTCRWIDVRPCPPGQVRFRGRCRPNIKPCPAGTVRHHGRCKPIIKPCPKGTLRRHGQCRPIDIIKPCPRGEIRIRGRCRPIFKPCPAGTQRRGKRCVPIDRPDRPKCGPYQRRSKHGCLPIIKPPKIRLPTPKRPKDHGRRPGNSHGKGPGTGFGGGKTPGFNLKF